MASQLVTISPVTLTAGTARAVATHTGSAVYASSVIIEAATANAGALYWGDSTVTTTVGHVLNPGDVVAFTHDSVFGVNNKIDLRSIFLVCATSDDKFRASYFNWNGL